MNFFHCIENGTISVHNVATNVDGSFTDICGYGIVPDPAVPGALSVSLFHLFFFCFHRWYTSCQTVIVFICFRLNFRSLLPARTMSWTQTMRTTRPSTPATTSLASESTSTDGF
jgi:hypothetical protein